MSTTPAAAAAAAAPKSTAKKDRLRNIELELEKEWADAHLYEANAPADYHEGEQKDKYLVTFPYPYMNGCLHIGHSFTITKAEFAARYEKLKGKNALFPFGFHCTGMPIKACADKLRHELEQYGNPPVFPKEEEPAAPAAEAAATATAAAAAEEKKGGKKGKKKETEGGVFHGSKAKVSQKAVKRQWDILLSNGIPPEEIPKFVDPLAWLHHFPTQGMEDLKLMGVAVDWRRSFITTDANPFYDSFVRWQFETLRDLQKIDFGKRYTIYSPVDGQACADHERAEGEGVLPQEYTLIKMEVVRGHPDVPCKLAELLAARPSAHVYFVAGTLRPETMYGQTNCWALPGGAYGAFEGAAENEIYVCTRRAARNMAYQGLSKRPGEVSCVAELDGSELIGTPLHAPLAQYEVVHVLPMMSISPEKGTGIVTSVPSDSPDDWTNFMQLVQKPEYRHKLGVKDEWVVPFKVVPIIHIPEIGDVAAETVCAEFKVKGPGDREALEKAKEKTYLKGFYTGEMLLGPHKGLKVKDAKPLVRDAMLKAGEALVYSEPAGRVVSRSGDECVVALIDQWYLKYGEPEWRAKTEAHVKTMDFYNPAGLGIITYALSWMNQWACSRNFGLGTRLPWDPKYLIESLSDSTIYMAYYTVAHLLQGNTLNSSKPNALGIRPEQMTRAVWDHIFLGAPAPADTTIPAEALATLRREFTYWYPLDLRVSGKDLLQNHLLFCLYNHTAIFPEALCPRAFRANGHLLLNNMKMSKSTGNFLTLRDGVEKYSADGMRIALADAGDSIDDANFVFANADASLLRLYTQIQWFDEILKNPAGLLSAENDDTEAAYNFQDKVFDSAISKALAAADKAYSRALYREALLHAFYDLLAARDSYRAMCDTLGVPMKRSLIFRFIEAHAIAMSPIAPHFADYLWRTVLKRDGFIWSNATWPAPKPVDAAILKKSAYIERLLNTFRVAIANYTDPKKHAKKNKGKDAAPPPPAYPTDAEIILASAFPEWIARAYDVINRLYDKTKGEFPAMAALIEECKKDPVLKPAMKKAMAKIGHVQNLFKEHGEEALVLQPPFDENAVLSETLVYIRKSLNLANLTIRHLEAVDEKIVPGEPGFAILK